MNTTEQHHLVPCTLLYHTDIPSSNNQSQDAPPTYGEAMEEGPSLAGVAALTSIGTPALPPSLHMATASSASSSNAPPSYDESQKMVKYYATWGNVLDAHARWPTARGQHSQEHSSQV